jgi:hypothetical protein
LKTRVLLQADVRVPEVRPQRVHVGRAIRVGEVLRARRLVVLACRGRLPGIVSRLQPPERHLADVGACIFKGGPQPFWNPSGGAVERRKGEGRSQASARIRGVKLCEQRRHVTRGREDRGPRGRRSCGAAAGHTRGRQERRHRQHASWPERRPPGAHRSPRYSTLNSSLALRPGSVSMASKEAMMAPSGLMAMPSVRPSIRRCRTGFEIVRYVFPPSPSVTG